jgi:glycosyltransferase 2 family protein
LSTTIIGEPVSNCIGTTELAQTKPKRPRWYGLLFRYGTTILILGLLFRKIPGGEVSHSIRQILIPDLLLATVSSLTGLGLIAWRLKLLSVAPGLTLNTARFFEIHLATLFYGLFLPGGNLTGIAVRLYKLSQAQQSMLGAATALFFDRLAATVTLLIVGIGFWLLEQPDGNQEVLAVMVGGLIFFLILTAIALAPEHWPGVHLFKYHSELTQSTFGKLREVLAKMRSLPGKMVVLVLLIAFLAQMLGTASYMFLATAVGVDMPFVTIGWLRTAMILATMIPISVSGLGLREGATLYILSSYGGSPEMALAYSLAVFAVTILLPGLLGGGLELRRFFKASQIR